MTNPPLCPYQSTPLRPTYKIGTIQLESQEYHHATTNQGTPWTLGEVIALQHGEFIASAIIEACEIEGGVVIHDIDLSGVDFQAMGTDGALDFWGKFSR